MIKDSISIIPFKRNNRNKWQKPHQLCINNIPQFNEGKYLCGTVYKRAKTLTILEFKRLLKIQSKNEEYPFEIKNFSYNGFSGHTKGGLASYKAKFNSWTGDPGIVIMDCSDKIKRSIPTFAIIGSLLLPKDDTNEKVLFGSPSHS